MLVCLRVPVLLMTIDPPVGTVTDLLNRTPFHPEGIEVSIGFVDRNTGIGGSAREQGHRSSS